jgi:hypothetical protein
MSAFAFRASAAALGGFFTRPVNEPVPVQAATVLPSVGGYGTARAEPFRFRELVSFRSAYTQVIGNEYEEGGQYERSTLALAVIEGLNVLDMVTADRVVGRLVSETALPGDRAARAAAPARELTWLPAGSYFVNLRIAGRPVTPTPHERIFEPEASTCSGVKKIVGREGDPLRCHLFSDRSPITIPGFGDIFLGEYLVASDYRRLTMIRIVMHSPAGGELVAASLEGNGILY